MIQLCTRHPAVATCSQMHVHACVEPVCQGQEVGKRTVPADCSESCLGQKDNGMSQPLGGVPPIMRATRRFTTTFC